MAIQFFWDEDDLLSCFDDGLDETELEELGIHPVEADSSDYQTLSASSEDDEDEEDAWLQTL